MYDLNIMQYHSRDNSFGLDEAELLVDAVKGAEWS
jgi:hypothetical protein